MDGVQDYRKRRRAAVTVITPKDLAALMREAQSNRPEMVPYLALRAFGGLRNCEASLIDWKDIYVTNEPDGDGFYGWVTISDEIAKQKDEDDGVRRTVPVRAILREWLLPYSKESGRIAPHVNMPKQLTKLRRDAKIRCPKNALRHSFISYALALSNDIATIAYQSGNTPDVIRASYLRVIRPDLAAPWFAVSPSAPKNVTPMPSPQRGSAGQAEQQCHQPSGEPSLASPGQS
jgi:integrase